MSYLNNSNLTCVAYPQGFSNFPLEQKSPEKHYVNMSHSKTKLMLGRGGHTFNPKDRNQPELHRKEKQKTKSTLYVTLPEKSSKTEYVPKSQETSLMFDFFHSDRDCLCSPGFARIKGLTTAQSSSSLLNRQGLNVLPFISTYACSSAVSV